MQRRNHHHHRTQALAVFFLLSATGTQAQLIPDAGQSLREIERAPLVLPPRQQLKLNLPDEAEAVIPVDTQRLAVRGFHFAGNTVFGGGELTALLAELAGRDLSLADLQTAARRITHAYRQRGYPLARAWLPQQEIADGIVRIDVLEGSYGEVLIDNRAGLRESALAPLAALVPGEAVRTGELERSLLLTRDLAGIDVHATLQPGASVGATDLLVEVLPGQHVTGVVEADNFGNRYTGEYRLGVALNLNNPLGLGDRLSVRLLESDEQQRYGRIDWQGSFGPWGTRLGLGYSQMRYELGKDFAVLDAYGQAHIASAWAVQPLVRTRDFSLSAALQFDDKRLEDNIGQFASRSRKHAQVWGATLSGHATNDWLDGGLSSFLLTVASGRLDLKVPLMRAQDALSARTQGAFHKFNPRLAQLQRLAGAFSLLGQIEGQWASGNLDSSEKLVLGGAQGVRAYPQGEAAGDQGWLAKLELRYAVAPDWQLSAFVDQGKVRINRTPWAAGRNQRRLAGVGLSAEWLPFGPTDGWRVQASAAWKTGEDATVGPDRRPYLWMRLVREF